MIHNSDIEIDIPQQPLTEFVLQKVVELANKPALIEGDTDRIITYEQLADSIRRVSVSLAARGFSKGNVMAIYSPNLPEYVITIHAVATLGGIITTVNPSYTAQELAYQLNDAGAKYLITIPNLLTPALEAVSQSKVEEVFVFGEASGVTSFSVLLEGEGKIPEIQINPQEDLLALFYSSGTTGLPKGVMHTHSTFTANFHQFQNCEPVNEIDTILGVLPFFHTYGMAMLNYSLSRGATVVTMQHFDLEIFVSLIAKHKITRTYVVPPILLALAKQPLVDKYNLSSLRVITSAAAPLSRELIVECEQRLGNCLLKQLYGTTETLICTHTLDERDKIKPGSVGKCLPGLECQIVNLDTHQLLGFNQPGELWVRGSQIMKGYWHNPQVTTSVIDADGWFHTGDIACVDEDGYLYIVDRIKELIKCNGYSVAPAELEAVLLTHPAVADACVVKSLHPTSGEVPKAFVVLKAKATPKEIIEFVASQVAPHKMIRRIEFVDKIPKSASGKILRRLLVEQELINTHQSVRIPPSGNDKRDYSSRLYDLDIDIDKIKETLKKSLAEILYIDISEIEEEQKFVDLGLDSIVGVEWITTINKIFDLNIKANKLYNYPHLLDLSEYIIQLIYATTSSEFLQKQQFQVNPSPLNHNSDEILSLLSRGEISLEEAKNFFSEVENPKIDSHIQVPVKNNDIAIIGIACRYPGAKNWQEFWENLKNGVDSITEVPPFKWEEKNWYHPDPEHPGTSFSRYAGFLDGIDKFDPLFFGISPQEAQFIEPQQRIFLEEAYHAIEDAGYSADSLKGKQCGVFVGAAPNNDYIKLLSNSGLDTHRLALTGNMLSLIPARIAYFLDLKGCSVGY